MKTFTKISLIVFAMMLATQVTNAQQQIPFQGMVSQGFGVAAWNADGSGPEPAATGHLIPFPGFGNIYYYGASRDYVSGNPNHACFAFLPGITEFPNFTQTLTDHGYLPGQVKVKFGLVTLGDDEEGLDWFVMNDFHHSSHKYSSFNIFELNGEPMLAIKVDFALWSVQSGTTTWIIDFGYTPVVDISGSSSAGVQAVAQAFLEDLDGKSIRLQCESTYGGINITGNGRNGALYNIINGTLTVGNPTLPFKGLFADNEGVAGWNADGTGPEPPATGHMNYLYYGASVDYGGINPSPDACLGHFLEGSTGFLHTLIQLEYRGFLIGDLKMKMGLASFGPDVEGEDWGYENGNHWLNQYNNVVTIMINGEPILQMMADTNKMVQLSSHWLTGTSTGKMYDISENASPASQYVAKSLLRDWGANYVKLNTSSLTYAGSFSGNGRTGAYYQINAGDLQGVYENITFVPPGEVSGTWTAEGSPYYVDGHLEIANGETLIIEPGVKVAVRGPYHFTVQGCVNAEGTEDENIIFTRSNPNLYWDGFDYDYTPSSNDSSLFQHCFFEYSSALGFPPYNSGGVFAIREYNKIIVDHCTFQSNQALEIGGGYTAGGGAIALWAASPVIRNSKFENNHSRYGGAIFCYANSNPDIQKNLFYSNSTTIDGGAIEIWDSSPTVMSNIFGLNNAAKGGAIDIYNNSLPIISNNLFYENEASNGGAISFYSYANGVLLNNTIVANISNFYGGAIYLYLGSGPEIINNIIWNNQANSGGNQIYNSGANNLTGYFYNNIEGGLSGFGGTVFSGSYLFNLDEDPLFINDSPLPYMISGSSPCVDAGTPDTSAWYYPQHLPATCLCGNPRKCYDRIDMGAFEFLEPGGIRDQKSPVRPFVVQPNPFMDYITISMDLNVPSDVSFYLYNSMGALLAQKDYGKLQAGQQEQRWYLSSLPEGIYLLAVKINNERFTQKVVKTK
jgi:hypothetical protein